MVPAAGRCPGAGGSKRGNLHPLFHHAADHRQPTMSTRGLTEAECTRQADMINSSSQSRAWCAPMPPPVICSFVWTCWRDGQYVGSLH
jgi:hypothetical protein